MFIQHTIIGSFSTVSFMDANINPTQTLYQTKTSSPLNQFFTHQTQPPHVLPLKQRPEQTTIAPQTPTTNNPTPTTQNNLLNVLKLSQRESKQTTF
jgi:hypothetical protein